MPGGDLIEGGNLIVTSAKWPWQEWTCRTSKLSGPTPSSPKIWRLATTLALSAGLASSRGLPMVKPTRRPEIQPGPPKRSAFRILNQQPAVFRSDNLEFHADNVVAALVAAPRRQKTDQRRICAGRGTDIGPFRVGIAEIASDGTARCTGGLDSMDRQRNKRDQGAQAKSKHPDNRHAHSVYCRLVPKIVRIGRTAAGAVPPSDTNALIRLSFDRKNADCH